LAAEGVSQTKQKQLKREGTKPRGRGREGKRERALEQTPSICTCGEGVSSSTCLLTSKGCTCKEEGQTALRKYRRFASKGFFLPKFTGLQFSVNRWSSP